MNRDLIKEYLPHREPMLLVDELEIIDGEAQGKYLVRGDEFFLQGHFPGDPIVPGVILCEIMGQSCALLVGDSIKGKSTYFTGMNNVRFKSPARPGDLLIVKAKKERAAGPFFFAKCEMKKEDGTLICKGELSFALVDKKG